MHLISVNCYKNAKFDKKQLYANIWDQKITKK